MNERQDKGSGTVKMQEEVAKVKDFKYLGSTVQSNGECRREVKNSGVSRVGLRGGGGFQSHKFKWLVKVGANKGVIRVDLKKNHGRGVGFRATRKPP